MSGDVLRHEEAEDTVREDKYIDDAQYKTAMRRKATSLGCDKLCVHFFVKMRTDARKPGGKTLDIISTGTSYSTRYRTSSGSGGIGSSSVQTFLPCLVPEHSLRRM